MPARSPARPAGTAHEQLADYLTERDRRRAYAIARARGGMEPREAALVREAAVMGFVQGRMHADVPVPRDEAIVDLVVDACIHADDLYPVTAAMAEPVPTWSPREALTRATLELHHPTQSSAGEGAPGHGDGTTQCVTCRPTDDWPGWPCATLSLLGRVARCENYLETEERPCAGYLVFPLGAPQARCLSCGAWCGCQAATYV